MSFTLLFTIFGTTVFWDPKGFTEISKGHQAWFLGLRILHHRKLCCHISVYFILVSVAKQARVANPNDKISHVTAHFTSASVLIGASLVDSFNSRYLQTGTCTLANS